jgi:hypothetical protein
MAPPAFELSMPLPMQTHATLRTLGVLFLAALASACESGTGSPAVDTVIIEADASDLVVGETLQLQVTAYDDDGDVITGRPVEWTSSNPGIATVSGTGLLTGVAGGTVEITATIGGESDSQSFEVLAPCPAQPYTLGSTVNGTLTATDCTFQDGTYVDYYSFILANPRQVTITLRSTQIDAYLVIFSATGTLVEENNNGGGGSDAQIVRTLAPGTYYIAANSFTLETGGYTLSSQ